MAITLKEAIAKFPKNAETVIEHQIPDNFKQLSYIDKIKYLDYQNKKAIINVDEDKLFFGIKTEAVIRRGHNVFVITTWSETIIIQDNKIKCKTAYNSVKYFFRFINNRLVEDLKSFELAVLCKPIMLRAMLCEKIYSIETFYKHYMLYSYHLKNFDWKLFRTHVSKGLSFISILDLQHFTVNLENSMRVLSQFDNTWDSTFTMYKDLIQSAVKLDEKVNLNWSINRIQEEHLRQTRQLMKSDIDSKPIAPIFDSTIGTDSIKLINSERDVYLEGMTMHHCLYTCYWRLIKNREYIAFHMKAPQDCTFSVKIVNNSFSTETKCKKLMLDQIYLAYDKQVEPSTKEIALKFIEDNSKELLRLLDN